VKTHAPVDIKLLKRRSA